MSNLVCPAMPVAAIGKVGVPSFSASAVQTIHFRMIALVLFDSGHAKDVPFLGDHFLASYCF